MGGTVGVEGGDTLRATGSGPRRVHELRRGGLVGRYVVVERVGSGGMGVVYAAYDPELDRKVAVKLLYPTAGTGSRAARAKARLQREARALAKLSHPNVVAIHDVGTVDDQVFIAMEFVDGQTLTQWQQTPRTRTAIVNTYRAAGRGLAAAHAAGLIHRDFKPENVMIGRDGRVRVTDFGLVQAIDPLTGSSSGDGGVTSMYADDAPQTQGTGTPAYMAPEQFRGEPTGPATDQFSFCVALYEALCGARPFAGANAVALAASVCDGRIEPSSRVRLPRRLRRALERGLRPDGRGRFPSMDALLAAINVSGTWRRPALIASMTGLVALAGAAGPLQRHLDEADCADGATEARSVWDDAARERVHRSLDGGGVLTRGAWERVDGRLRQITEAWETTRIEACEAVAIEETWSAERHDATVVCLDDVLGRVRGMVGVLGGDDPIAASLRVSAVANLDDPTMCLQRRNLGPYYGRSPNPSPEQRGDRQALHRADALAAAGRYEESLEVARALADRADEGLRPSAMWRMGVSLEQLGRSESAEAALTEAFFTAGRRGQPIVAARAAVQLIAVVGGPLSRPDEGRRWGQFAEMLDPTLIDGRTLGGAQVLEYLGQLDWQHGEPAKAVQLHRRALDIRVAELGPDHVRVASSRLELGLAMTDLGEMAQASVELEAALRGLTAALGPQHPRVAAALNNLGRISAYRGEYAHAAERFGQAAEVLENSVGPEHPEFAMTLHNLGAAHRLAGDLDLAFEQLGRARELLTAARGPHHPMTAMAIGSLASAFADAGEADRARVLWHEALDLRVQTLGPDHPDVADSLWGLAEAAFDAGAVGEAETDLRRVVRIRRAALGARHDRVASALVFWGEIATAGGDHTAADERFAQAVDALGDDPRPALEGRVQLRWGQTLTRRGHHAQAVEALERALAALGQINAETERFPRAEVEVCLARALAELGRVDRARALATAARDGDDAAWGRQARALLRTLPQ